MSSITFDLTRDTTLTTLEVAPGALPQLHEVAPALLESHVRSVDTFNKLTAQISRRDRRQFARTHKLDTASPARWPHDARMLACQTYHIDPVLGIGGTKHVKSAYGIDVAGAVLSDETAEERALAEATAEPDEFDEESERAEPDIFDDLPAKPAGATIFIEPARDEHLYVAPATKNLLRMIERLSGARPINCALRGPTGCGKTSLPEWFAWRTKRPYFVFDTPTIRETVDAFGMRTLDYDAEGKQQIKMQLSGLIQAVQTPRACIVIDEATRAHPSLLNGMLALLDHRKRVWLDSLQASIEVAPGVVFFVTANIGSQYTGTWMWDAAFENRMDFQLDVGYLEAQREIDVLTRKTGVDAKIAKAMVEIANLIRQRVNDTKQPLPHAVSTRQALRACEAVVHGLSPLEALEFTIVPTYSTDGGSSSDRAHVLQIIQGKLAA
jgi:nitric oxide reductase NorQ protein